MSTADQPLPAPESREERIRRLATLCTLDRLHLQLEFSSTASSEEAPGGDALQRVLGATRHLPGAIGRWSRRLAFGASVLRALR
jgi:hypothetical protein